LERKQEFISSRCKLSQALLRRMQGDRDAVAITLRDEVSSRRYARKLLHRLSQSLAFALLCEAAGAAEERGNPTAGHSAWRYFLRDGTADVWRGG
jgi:hypothetical protein